MTDRQATTARAAALLLGMLALAGAGWTLYLNAAGLTLTHAVFVGALAAVGGLLIDPVHVGQALASVAGVARQAKDSAPATTAPPAPPTGGDAPQKGDAE